MLKFVTTKNFLAAGGHQLLNCQISRDEEGRMVQEEAWKEEVESKALDETRMVTYKRTYVVTETPGKLTVETKTVYDDTPEIKKAFPIGLRVLIEEKAFANGILQVSKNRSRILIEDKACIKGIEKVFTDSASVAEIKPEKSAVVRVNLPKAAKKLPKLPADDKLFKLPEVVEAQAPAADPALEAQAPAADPALEAQAPAADLALKAQASASDPAEPEAQAERLELRGILKDETPSTSDVEPKSVLITLPHGTIVTPGSTERQSLKERLRNAKNRIRKSVNAVKRRVTRPVARIVHKLQTGVIPWV